MKTLKSFIVGALVLGISCNAFAGRMGGDGSRYDDDGSRFTFSGDEGSDHHSDEDCYDYENTDWKNFDWNSCEWDKFEWDKFDHENFDWDSCNFDWKDFDWENCGIDWDKCDFDWKDCDYDWEKHDKKRKCEVPDAGVTGTMLLAGLSLLAFTRRKLK